MASGAIAYQYRLSAMPLPLNVDQEPMTPAPPQDSVIEAVNKRLKNLKYAMTRNIQVELADGAIELTGTVPSFHFRQLVESTVLTASEDYPIRSRIQVVEFAPEVGAN